MDEKEIEFLSLRERIRELEQRLDSKENLIYQKDEMIKDLFAQNEELQNMINDYANENKMYFGTRNQQSVTKEYLSIIDAVKDFVSYDGYRLDIIIDKVPSLHIYRDELPILKDEEKMDMMIASKSLDYEAKVVVVNAFTEGE